MDTQYFPYGWSTGTVHEHPAVLERATVRLAKRTWPIILIRWATFNRVSIAKERSRANSYYVTLLFEKAPQFPAMFDKSNLVYSTDVD